MRAARRELSGVRTEVVEPPVDRLVAALATRQHGVLSRAQLRELGLSQTGIARRIEQGRLLRVHRGVYAVGHRALARHGHWMAAVLAAGPGAALSHAAAGALWALRPSEAARIDVSVPTPGGRARRDIRIHRASSLAPDKVTTHHGIRVTTPVRTILDLAARLPRRPLERLLDQAETIRLTDVAALDAVARAHAGHLGAGRLLAALDAHVPGTTVTRSALEERFLELCDAAGLARPRVNVHVEGLEVDFLFEADRLVVETDGYRHHGTRHAFENDRARDAILAAAGYRTLRFTYRQLTDHPGQVAAALRPLRRPRPPTSSSRSPSPA